MRLFVCKSGLLQIRSGGYVAGWLDVPIFLRSQQRGEGFKVFLYVSSKAAIRLLHHDQRSQDRSFESSREFTLLLKSKSIWCIHVIE